MDKTARLMKRNGISALPENVRESASDLFDFLDMILPGKCGR
jgi:hypothetical protein